MQPLQGKNIEYDTTLGKLSMCPVGLMVKQRAMMQRVENVPFPVVTPGRQGSAALDLLTAEQKSMVKAGLTDAMAYYNCQKDELEWSMNPKTGILHIRRKKCITV